MRPDTRESIVQIFKRGSSPCAEPRERENRRRLTSEHVSPSDRYFLSSLVAKNTPDCFYNFFFLPHRVVYLLPLRFSRRFSETCKFMHHEEREKPRTEDAVSSSKPEKPNALRSSAGYARGFSLSPVVGTLRETLAG